MGFDQYHEPPEELSQETRTYARVLQSLIEEAEAISWYTQRLAVEKDEEARAVMGQAQKEEFIHFGMDLEFLLRRTPDWRKILKNILFKKGDLIELAEKAEEIIEALAIGMTFVVGHAEAPLANEASAIACGFQNFGDGDVVGAEGLGTAILGAGVAADGGVPGVLTGH